MRSSETKVPTAPEKNSKRSHQKATAHLSRGWSRFNEIRKEYKLYEETWPLVGASGAAVAALVLTELIGVGELILAGAVAYGTFQLFRRGKLPKTTAKEAISVAVGMPE